jgi:hypothetical protein
MSISVFASHKTDVTVLLFAGLRLKMLETALLFLRFSPRRTKKSLALPTTFLLISIYLTGHISS